MADNAASVSASDLVCGLGQMPLSWCAFVFCKCKAGDNFLPCLVRCQAVIRELIAHRSHLYRPRPVAPNRVNSRHRGINRLMLLIKTAFKKITIQIR